MHFTSYLQNGQLTIALSGEIDHHHAKKYIQAISAKIEAYLPRACILDFQEVSFMDSSGIAVVINSMRNMSRIGGELFLCGLKEQPMKVFTASGIEQLVKIKEGTHEI